MLSSLQRHPQHPLRFLLYLEWVLLATVLVSEAAGISPFQVPRLPGLNLVGLVVFGVMGLRLPDRRSSRLAYTLVEFAIVLLLSFVGGVAAVSLPLPRPEHSQLPNF